MNQEMVDVLNLEGEVVGIATRQEMRMGRLPHRCVYILVFNKVGEIFIHLRTATKDVFPSHWDVCAGGVVSAGEDFETGARREGFEELGILAELQYLFPFRYEDEQTTVFAKIYHCIHDGPFVLQKEEVVRGEFVSLIELGKRITVEKFCPDGLKVLEEAKSFGLI